MLPGINLALDGMRVGGLRLVTVPPQYAYGKKGKQPFIPGDATVDFAVQLLSVVRGVCVACARACCACCVC